jgi:Tol biopolymer transport system component
VSRGWSSACWFVASALLALEACEGLASSPPEAVAPAPREVSTPPCLAQTHPILAHVGVLGRQLLVALDPAGSSVELDRGNFLYGSTWSPDGRTIAFRRRPEAAGVDALAATDLALFSPDAPGEEVVLFVDATPPLDNVVRRYPDGPSWSPDGGQLVFASLRDSDHYRIWMIARSGGQARLLLPELEQVTHFYPRWSPVDPARVAYVAESAGVPDLWVVDLASGERDRLTSGEMAKLEAPRWSPDGQRLAFSAMPLATTTDRAPTYDVYVLDLATRERQKITAEAGNNYEPVWSPDAASVLVSSTRGSTATSAIPTLNLWRVWLTGNPTAEPLSRGVRGASTTGPDWYPSVDCGSPGL